MDSLGKRIKASREALGIDQRELAARVNVKQQTISKLETDKSKGTYIAPRLAEALRVSLSWLLTGQEPAAESELANPYKSEDLKALVLRLPLKDRQDLMHKLIDEFCK